jgi:hypothetical protein
MTFAVRVTHAVRSSGNIVSAAEKEFTTPARKCGNVNYGEIQEAGCVAVFAAQKYSPHSAGRITGTVAKICTGE